MSMDILSLLQLKERLCFFKHAYVALNYEIELQKVKSSSECNISYTIPDGNVITIADEHFRFFPKLIFIIKM